jgi:hypothetical protein
MNYCSPVEEPAMFRFVTKTKPRKLKRDSNKRYGLFRPARVRLEALEDRYLPSTLSIDSSFAVVYQASTTNTLTVTMNTGANTISFNDSVENISLSGAGSGAFSGNGTHTVAGPLSDVSSVSVSNSFGKGNSSNKTSLTVDDSADNVQRTVTLGAVTSVSVLGVTRTFGTITGLPSGEISYLASSRALLGFVGTFIGDVTIKTSVSRDTINVQNTVSPSSTTIDAESTINTIDIGNAGSVQGISGPLSIVQPSGFAFDALQVDDSADNTARSVVLSAGEIAGLAPANILYNTNFSVGITTGSANNRIDLVGTSPGISQLNQCVTTLATTGGNNTIDINAVAADSALGVQSQGTDTVNIVPTSSTSIAGTVSLANTGSLTTLNVQDFFSFGGQVVTLTNSQITGLQPGTIQYIGSELKFLFIEMGDAGAPITINVVSTSVGTTLEPLDMSTAVNVGDNDTLGDPGSVQGIAGPLYVYDQTLLTIDDSADASARVASIGSGSLTGLAPAAISWDPTSLLSLTVDGGNGGNTFTINNPGPEAFLNDGTGADKVYLQASGQNVTINNKGGADAIVLGSQAPLLGGTVASNILGQTVITNAGGTSTLLVDDSADTAGQSAALEAMGSNLVIAGLAGSFIFYSGVTQTTILMGRGDDNFAIDALPTTPVLLNGGGGNNTLTGPNVPIAWSINAQNGGTLGTVTFSSFQNLVGGTGNDTFQFTSTGSLTGTADGGGGTNTLVGPDQATNWLINAANAGKMGSVPFVNFQNVTGGSGNDVFQLTQAGSLAGTVNGGGGSNKLIGRDQPSTWIINAVNGGMLGTMPFTNVQNLVGGAGNDMFQFTPIGRVAGTVDGGGGTNTLDYSGIGNVACSVSLQTAQAPRIQSGLPGGFTHIQAFVGSSSPNNFLYGPNLTDLWQITGPNMGQVAGVTFSAFQNLVGGRGTGNNTFRFSLAGSVTSIHGGGSQGNWLDYSLWSGSSTVTVNLATGSASGVALGAQGAVVGIQNVLGGGGNNVLTGNGGNILIGGSGINVITGGSGRSLLIGGSGSSTLTAGSAGDILIAGTTIYDANETALQSLLAEWQSADSYPLRFQRLEGLVPGGLNGNNKLVWGNTVKDDDAASVLKGGAGLDWFFANPNADDTITNLNNPGKEHVDNNP